MHTLATPLLPPENKTHDRIPIVRIRHPAYNLTGPSLLDLPAVDGDCTSLDYELALTACSIITGNTEGYLARHEGDAEAAFSPIQCADGLLRPGIYFYCLKGSEGKELENKYPVVPSFDHWRFPHGKLPKIWRDLVISPHNYPPSTKGGGLAALQRDQTCRISGHSHGLDTAHLVPAVYSSWFASNDMMQYCSRRSVPKWINNDKNLLCLRKDLHFLFDTRRLVLVPKLSRHPPPASPQIALHVLLPSESDQMLELYHNRQLQPLRDIAVEFLFSRFAWLILHPETYTFIQPTTTRYEIKVWDQDKGVSKTESISGFAFGDNYASRSRSRSLSPTKRARTEEQQDWGLSQDGIDDSGSAWETWLGWEQRELGEERRGRSRARKRSRKMRNSLPPQEDRDSGLSQSEIEPTTPDNASSTGLFVGCKPGERPFKKIATGR